MGLRLVSIPENGAAAVQLIAEIQARNAIRAQAGSLGGAFAADPRDARLIRETRAT